MWSNILNEPKNVTPFRKDQAKLMNVAVGYENDKEMQNNYPDLLPKDDSLKSAGIKRSRVPSRSMLGKLCNIVLHGICRTRESKIRGNKVMW